ncbi:hypothetical protein QJS10_CPB12g01428 [Acorus calamus]|uniref:DUF8204 domain-containing protein n=1 Tax=Acorus calamus TaxID=4465 RepID=A0AAV9DKN0_ACOCL|nr:hypothetical protein QJS10_CPB12g01428 [Acorus calamus]
MEEDSNSGEGGGGLDEVRQPIGGEADGGGDGGGAKKARSCKGCLYYASSSLKPNAGKPICVGISRTLAQVPSYVVRESEMETSKEDRSPTDFKYACAGYSVFIDNNESTTDQQKKQAELPFCVGIELLVDRRPSTAENGPIHAPRHAHNHEDGHVHPQPRSPKPAYSGGDEFLTRFRRNASLVASGVAKNVHRVGNYMKVYVDNILYPYRRPPK